MKLPINNAEISVENGYSVANKSRRVTTYSYSVTDKTTENSNHNFITNTGANVYSGGTVLSLKKIDTDMSTINNWGEFTPYSSLTVLNPDGDELYIRPILNGTKILLSARNNTTEEETEVCSYGYTETAEMPDELSFYVNVGTITYSPFSRSYSSGCTFYAIKGQSGCGYDGVGNITLSIDSSPQSFINKTYAVVQNSKEEIL